MEKWFEKQSRLIQILLLLVPGINWIVEVLVRWDHALSKKKANVIDYVMAVLATLSVGILGWLDLIWCLLFKKLFLCD